MKKHQTEFTTQSAINAMILFLCNRCGEEEEPCVWVCHTTGGLWGRCTPKARSERFVSPIFNKTSIMKFKLHTSASFRLCLCPQAIVLEGSYWKQRIEVVIREYHKWRIYYKKRVRTHCNVYFVVIMQCWSWLKYCNNCQIDKNICVTIRLGFFLINFLNG